MEELGSELRSSDYSGNIICFIFLVSKHRGSLSFNIFLQNLLMQYFTYKLYISIQVIYKDIFSNPYSTIPNYFASMDPM